VIDDLAHFIAGARWFGGKGRAFTVLGFRRLGEVPGGDGFHVAIDLAELEFPGSGPDEHATTELYHLPLLYHPEPQDRLEHALIGVWHDDQYGHCHVYDALHDHDAMALVLRAFVRADTSGPLRFHRVAGHDLDVTAQSAMFTGEQSNSSVAFAEDSLLKVFRKVTPGVNPDIQVHEVLTREGSEHVAALYGWLDLVDPEAGDGEESVLQLAMLQQFLRTASDGFELAKASVRNLYAEADLHADEVGGDFAGESARLGVALAETHRSLAEAFPTGTRSSAEMATLAATMHRRLDETARAVPELEPYVDGLRAAYDAVAVLDGVDVQRIHGDLHLGQTLRTVRGWKIVDFEGEPAKPLSERILPNPVWRDVAGMLRSFDYAAAVVGRIMDEGDEEETEQRNYRASEWGERNRRAFVSAYAGRELTRFEQVLLDAYEVDKAVYECGYEAGNRPDWLPIPLAAVARLAGADSVRHG
jgi:maltokinase